MRIPSLGLIRTLALTAAASARCQLAASGLGLMALVCIPAQAAYTYGNCTLTDSNATYVAHVVGRFKSDSKQFDPLTEWIDIPHPNAWTCIHYTDDPKRTVEIVTKPWTYGFFWPDYTFDGEGPYTIYHSPFPAHKQVAFIMTRRYHLKAPSVNFSWSSPWLPVWHGNDDDAHPPSQQLYLALPHLTEYTVEIEYRVRLLKWWENKHDPNLDFPRTGDAIEFQVVDWRLWIAQFGWPPVGSGLPNPQDYVARQRRYSRVSVWFNREDKTCSTPSSDKIVRLAGVDTSAFSGPGSVAGTVGFNLELFGCTGVNGIEYKLTPVRVQEIPPFHAMALETAPWPLTPEQGTLPLSSASTATGVRIQVLDETGTPVKFDRTSRLQAINYTPGATSASIPLRARYLQTGATVTPGTVYATMSVLYMYK